MQSHPHPGNYHTGDFYIVVLVCVFLNTTLLYAAAEACEAHVCVNVSLTSLRCSMQQNNIQKYTY